MSPDDRRALCVLSALVMIASTAKTGLAQTVDPQSAAAHSPGQVVEVVVTAQRRAENMQRIPVAVSAYDARALEARQLTSVLDVAQVAPNVQFSAGSSGAGSSANIFIRGIGQVDFVPTTDPGVGTYVDGVYLARATGAALDLGDVQQVEVLRGPQGTLFGRNTIGGALNVTTVQPTNQFSGRLEETIGNLGRYEERVTLNLPLVDDKLALRMNLLNTQNDGYGAATLKSGESVRLGAQNEFAGRAQLLAKPTDTLQVLFSIDGTHSRGTTDPASMVAWTPSPTAAAYNAVPGVIPIGRYDVTTNLNNLHYSVSPTEDLDVLGGSVTLIQTLDHITVKSISAYRWQRLVSGQDYSGTAAEYLNQYNHQSSNQFSQEFQFLGNSFGDKLIWVSGLYYFKEFDTFDTDVTEATLPIEIVTDNGVTSYAAYGQATYHLTSKLSFTAGIRYTDERKHISATTDFAGAILVPDLHRVASFTAASPKGAIEYQATDDIMAYASISRGFRSGGFNGRPFAASDLTPYAPETTTSYEVGAKTEWLDRRLRLDLAGFYTDYKDIQLSATLEENGQFTVVTGNAASAKIAGFEAEFEAQPTHALTVFGALGYIHDSLRQNPGFSFGSRLLPNTPDVTTSLGFDYAQPLGEWGKAALNVSANYRSSTVPQFDPTPTISPYTLLGAQLRLTPNGQPWQVTLYAKNLTDAQYWVFAETTGIGPTVAWFGRPREFGLKAAFDF